MKNIIRLIILITLSCAAISACSNDNVTSNVSFSFDAPYSISEKKPADSDYLEIFLDADGKVFLKFVGNPKCTETSTAKLKKDILQSALEGYNDLHPGEHLKLSDDAVRQFVNAEYIGSSLKSLAAGNPATSIGLKPSDNSEDMQLWLNAAYKSSPAMNEKMRDGSGIIIKSSRDTPFSHVKKLLRCLSFNRFNIVSFVTSPMNVYKEIESSFDYDIPDDGFKNCYAITVYLPTVVNEKVEIAGDYEPKYLPLIRSDDGAEEELPTLSLDNLPADCVVPLCVGGDFPSTAYALFFNYKDVSLPDVTNDRLTLFGRNRNSLTYHLVSYNLPHYRRREELGMKYINDEVTDAEYFRKKREIATSDAHVHPVIVLKMNSDATLSTFVATLTLFELTANYDYRIILD